MGEQLVHGNEEAGLNMTKVCKSHIVERGGGGNEWREDWTEQDARGRW